MTDTEQDTAWHCVCETCGIAQTIKVEQDGVAVSIAKPEPSECMLCDDGPAREWLPGAYPDELDDELDEVDDGWHPDDNEVQL